RIEAETDLVGETEAIETAGREDDGVETAFPALAQTRIDVPAQGLDRERGLEGEQLCTPSDRRGADAHPRLQGIDTTERIARILALEVRADRESVRVRRRHVLRGMHRDVDPAIKKRLFELLDEHSARTDFAERSGAVAVARSGDRHERDLDTRTAKPRRGQLGLRERESTAAGADADQHGTR